MASDKSRALDDVVAAVAQARPHLADPQEAVALLQVVRPFLGVVAI
jgi:hypothetical protein